MNASCDYNDFIFDIFALKFCKYAEFILKPGFSFQQNCVRKQFFALTIHHLRVTCKRQLILRYIILFHTDLVHFSERYKLVEVIL